MFESLESGWGLDFVQMLADTRGPLGDLLARALHFSGGTLFFLVVLPIIYWGIDRKLGMRLMLALTVSYALGTLLKTQFAAPRPFHSAPELITPLFEQDGHGFPSNHVLLAVAVWGYLAAYLRNRWVNVVVAILVMAHMWGRVYAGVHYVHDVIGGLIFGFIALWILTQALIYLPPRWLRWSDTVKFSLTIGSSLLIYLLLSQNEAAAAVAGLWSGCGLGIILKQKWSGGDVAGSYGQRTSRVLFGLILLVSFFFAARALFAYLGTEESSVATALKILRYCLTVILGLTIIPRMFMFFSPGAESKTT